jgi:hypothetical protein
MVWSAVGARYRELFSELVERWQAPALPRPAAAAPIKRLEVAPPVRAHLAALDHPLGLYQHARGAQPNPEHGFCTDDMARRLMVDLLHAQADPGPDVAASVISSVDFLERAWNPAPKRFRNFLDIRGRWLEQVGSEDCHGRAVQALGEMLARWTEGNLRARAGDLLEWADELIGCEAARRGGWRGDREGVFETLAARLAGAFASARSESRGAWPWPEPNVLYDNGVLPEALIVAGRALGEPEYVQLGLESLRWLVAAQTAPDGHLTPVGNRGWWPRGGRPARFDQQPIEATSLLEGARAAYNATTDPRWAETMERAYGWFLGVNDLGLALADPERGACRDGLNQDGVNENQGAESTLVWLLAVERIRELRARSVGVGAAAVGQ